MFVLTISCQDLRFVYRHDTSFDKVFTYRPKFRVYARALGLSIAFLQLTTMSSQSKRVSK